MIYKTRKFRCVCLQQCQFFSCCKCHNGKHTTFGLSHRIIRVQGGSPFLCHYYSTPLLSGLVSQPIPQFGASSPPPPLIHPLRLPPGESVSLLGPEGGGAPQITGTPLTTPPGAGGGGWSQGLRGFLFLDANW